MLRRVVSAARAVTRAEGAAILLHDRERGLFVPTRPSVAMGLDERWLQRQGLEAAQTLALRAVEARDIVDLTDTAAEPELEFPLLAGGRRPGAVSVAPLQADEEAVGVLELYHAAPRHAPVDRDLLQSFAALASMAIEAARGHERERSLRGRLEALDTASKALVAELSPDRVLRRIVEIATALAGARYGALGVIGADGYLADFITTGLTPEDRRLIGPLPRGHGLLGVLIRGGLPLRVPHIGRDPRRVGFPSNHPSMTSLLGVPIRVRDAVVGDLYLTDKIGAVEFSEEDQRLVELLAAHAGVAIENARLHEQVGDLAMQRERDRIGRDLHDGIIQDIYGATLQLENAAEDVADGSVQAQLLGIVEQLDRVVGNIRYYIQGLVPRDIAQRPLAEGLAALIDEVNGWNGAQASWEIEGDPYPLPDLVVGAVLHVAREALANVARHAQATTARVRLHYGGDGVTITVEDDGQGFDPGAARAEQHRGLRNLRSRAEEAGGTLTVRSAPRAGTTLGVWIPARR